MREYSAAVGASDGSIIAAIITTQTPRNQPSAPSADHGPSSMPSIRSAVHHQPTAASAKSSATSPSRERTAAAGASRAGAITASCRPRELGLREPGLALVGDAEGVDARALGLGHREVGPGGMEHAGEAHGLAG